MKYHSFSPHKEFGIFLVPGHFHKTCEKLIVYGYLMQQYQIQIWPKLIITPTYLVSTSWSKSLSNKLQALTLQKMGNLCSKTSDNNVATIYYEIYEHSVNRS